MTSVVFFPLCLGSLNEVLFFTSMLYLDFRGQKEGTRLRRDFDLSADLEWKFLVADLFPLNSTMGPTVSCSLVNL